MKERVMIVGSGGREAAMFWALGDTEKICVPGNAQATSGKYPHVSALDFEGLLDVAYDFCPDVIVIGPDAPVVAGAGDFFRSHGYSVIAPGQVAAQLEGSKVFAKRFMLRHSIPTAPFRVFTDPGEAYGYIKRRKRAQVVKADGLCAGKGVAVADDEQEAMQAANHMLVGKKHGEAGNRIVIEDRLYGREASFIVGVRGKVVIPMIAAMDYKRRRNGNRGEMTGGMGCVAPHPCFPVELQEEVMEMIVLPTIRGIAYEGAPYQGFLYVGLMFTDDGPMVLEFNTRMGDPECQGILPLLREGCFLDLVLRTGRGNFAGAQVAWKEGRKAVVVVLVEEGYPDSSKSGAVIKEIPPDLSFCSAGSYMFHAGTKRTSDGELLVAGGRVASAVGVGETYREGRAHAYARGKCFEFRGKDFLTDIAEGLS